MARQTGIVMAMVVLTALLFTVQAAGAATRYQEIQNTIDGGIHWLIDQQNEDGSWGEADRVARTGFAIIKLMDRSREIGEEDPLSGTYSSEIQNGLHFIFSKVQSDENQLDAGSIWDIPSYTPPYEPCEGSPFIVYETSIAIMAITNTRTPDARVSDPDSPVSGVTYKEVVQNAVKYLQKAQVPVEPWWGDLAFGGWSYYDQGPWITENSVCPDPKQADQSNSGYAVLALAYALDPRNQFHIGIPDESLKNLTNWVTRIQDPESGGAYSCYPDEEVGLCEDTTTNILRTGDLLIQQEYVGYTPDRDEVQKAIIYLGKNWNNPDPRSGWLNNVQAMYITTAGLQSFDSGSIPVSDSPRDWFADFEEKILATKVSGGIDEPGAIEKFYWPPDIWSWEDPLLSTEWTLLTLEGYVYPGSMTVTKTASATKVSAGQTVTYTFTVANTGQSAIYVLSLEDDQMGIIGIPDSGDDGDGILEPEEAWVYTDSQDLFVTTTNIAIASGVDLREREVIATSNPVTVVVTQLTAPAISVTKSSSASLVHTGDVVTYTYQVENAGDTPLSGIHLTDDQLDLTNIQPTGDNGGDGVLEQGETWIYKITVPVNAQVTNIATVTALGSDVSATSDPVTVDVIDPALEITKAASSTLIQAGDLVTYTLTVKNTGDITLDPVQVADLKVAGISCPYSALASGEVMACTATANPTGTVTNIATATGTDPIGGTVTASSNPVTVVVNHPPDVTPAYPSLACLWPPNHTFSDVTIRGITDPDGDPIVIAVTGVTSDEPTGSVTGAGGNKTHIPDAKINGGTVSLLRAERSGNSNGRVYAISFTASDGHGGVSRGTVNVNVPHSTSNRCLCIDDGQKYDATAVN